MRFEKTETGYVKLVPEQGDRFDSRVAYPEISVMENREVLDFGHMKYNGKTVRFCVSIETRPELRTLIAECKAIRDEIARQNEEKRQTEIRKDAELVEDARRKLPELLKKFPKNAIRIHAKVIGNLDGDEIWQYSVGQTILDWKELTIVGWLSAIRPGAFNPFYSEPVGYVLPEVLEARRKEQNEFETAQEEEEKREEKRKSEIFAKANATGQPQVLRSWVTDRCMNNSCECSFDQAVEYALPGGTKQICYNCCY